MFTTIKSTLLALTATLAFGAATHAAPLTIKTFAANAAGFHVTSNLIMGERNAVLVDAQFTRSEATKLADMIESTGRDLKLVYITHGHPDHYFGVEVLKQRFPNARFVGSQDTLDDIAATGEEKLKAWKGMYGEDLTDAVPTLEVFAANRITLEGKTIRIQSLVAGESAHSTVVVVPSLKTVITGDALYNDVHMWLAEGRIEGIRANLKALRRLGASIFLAGHSVTGLPASKELIAANEDYVQSFETALKTSASAEKAAEAIKAKYPTLALPIIADISAKSLFAN